MVAKIRGVHSLEEKHKFQVEISSTHAYIMSVG